MKIKTTQKAIKENCKNIFAVGYCEYYELLDKCKAKYYTCGIYGWNANVFIEYKTDTAIVTGYRIFGNRLNDEQIAIFEKYNEKARKLKALQLKYYLNENDNQFTFDRLNYILDKMLQNAIKKVLKCK